MAIKEQPHLEFSQTFQIHMPFFGNIIVLVSLDKLNLLQTFPIIIKNIPKIQNLSQECLFHFPNPVAVIEPLAGVAKKRQSSLLEAPLS